MLLCEPLVTLKPIHRQSVSGHGLLFAFRHGPQILQRHNVGFGVVSGTKIAVSQTAFNTIRIQGKPKPQVSDESAASWAVEDSDSVGGNEVGDWPSFFFTSSR